MSVETVVKSLEAPSVQHCQKLAVKLLGYVIEEHERGTSQASGNLYTITDKYGRTFEHIASAPFQPLAQATGEFRESLDTAILPWGAAVGIGAGYPHVTTYVMRWEFDDAAPRPTFAPAYDRLKAELNRA